MKFLRPVKGAVGSLLIIFLVLACGGGFQAVEKLEKIKLPEDLNHSIQIEKTSAPVPHHKETTSKISETKSKVKALAQISPFETKEAKKRAKYFHNLKTFRPGEKITLDLTWFSIKAAEITLEVLPYVYIEGRKAYHFKGTAKSYGAMNMIHSVDDWIESYVDVDTFYPYESALHGVESDRIREGLGLFDYVHKKIQYWMKIVRTNGTIKEVRRTDDFIPGIIDIFSSAYYLRAQKLEVGHTYHGEVYNAGKRITVDAEVLRKEKLENAFGEFDALVVRPIARFEGILQTQGDSTIWVTDDDRHFILQLETKIKIGYLMAKVKKIEDSAYVFPPPQKQEK